MNLSVPFGTTITLFSLVCTFKLQVSNLFNANQDDDMYDFPPGNMSDESFPPLIFDEVVNDEANGAAMAIAISQFLKL